MNEISATLSAIERSVVLSSLSSGRISVMVESEFGLPLKIDPKKMKVFDDSFVVIQNPDAELGACVGEDVTVRIVWNNVPISFDAQIKKIRSELAFAVPKELTRDFIPDISPKKTNRPPLCVTLFLKCEEKISATTILKERDFECAVRKFEHFSSLQDFSEELNARFQEILNEVSDSRCGISVSRYIAGESQNDDSSKPVVLFVDEIGVVLGFPNVDNFSVREGEENSIEFRFSLPRPLNERKISSSFVVEKIVRKTGCARFCAICNFSELQMEDERFLSEFR